MGVFDVLSFTITLKHILTFALGQFFLLYSKFLLKVHHLGPKKWGISGPTPSNGPSNGFVRIKFFDQIELEDKENAFRTLCGILSFFLPYLQDY